MPSKWDSNGNLIDGQFELAGSKFQDLGLVIDTTNMAAGATVYSPWYDSVSWVRNTIATVTSDQQYDLVMSRRDTGLFGNGDVTLAASQPANPSFWRSHASTGVNGILGYSFRIGIKNTSASANTFAKIRAQLMGL